MENVNWFEAEPKKNDENERLRVGELVDVLKTYPRDMLVGFVNNGYTGKAKNAVTKVLRMGFVEGELFMDKMTQVNVNRLRKEEIPDRQMDRYEKVLVLCARITPQEILESDLYRQTEMPYKDLRSPDAQSDEHQEDFFFLG